MRAVLVLMIAMVPAVARALSPEEIFAKVSPSIVVIHASSRSSDEVSTGSGVIVGPGEIVTNCHVVEGADRILIMRDGTERPARLRFADEDRDLCLLQTGKSSPFKRAITSLVAPDDLRVGQRVYAIGAPLGLELTMSQGIVSSLRPIEGGSKLIQTDASISPGSSGGGLFDEGGRLIGITTFLFRGGQNLNFAVPSNWILELPGRYGDASDAERKTSEQRAREQRQREAAMLAEQERRDRLLSEERARLDEERRQLEAERARLERERSTAPESAVAPSPTAAPTVTAVAVARPAPVAAAAQTAPSTTVAAPPPTAAPTVMAAPVAPAVAAAPPARPGPARPAPTGAPSSPAIDRRALESYGLMLSREIGKDPHYPRRAQMLGWKGTTEVLARIGADGNVKGVSIARSSGYEVLDEEAMEKVRRAKQLPPPEIFKGREFTVMVPIVFRLE